jgi:hypothetical protein
VKIFFRVGAGAVNYFVDYDNSTDFLKSRRKFVSQIGLGIAAVPFLSLIYGLLLVNTITGYKADLPRGI